MHDPSEARLAEGIRQAMHLVARSERATGIGSTLMLRCRRHLVAGYDLKRHPRSPLSTLSCHFDVPKILPLLPFAGYLQPPDFANRIKIARQSPNLQSRMSTRD